MSFVTNPYFFTTFWGNLSSTNGKVINGFSSVFTNALTVNWGDGTTTPLTSGVSVNKTLGTTNAIELETNNAVVTAINCGGSSPRLGGTVDISAFTNLQQFNCNSNEITALSGYSQNSNLQIVEFFDNNVTGSIASLSGLNNLQVFACSDNQLTGSIPSLSGLTSLRTFKCDYNQLTGSIPSLSGLTNLQDFWCNDNQLTGSIPSLSGLTNLQDFWCYRNQLTGSIPSLSGLTNLRTFYSYLTSLSGSIPSLSGLTQLIAFSVGFCQHTGSIPNLSGLNALQSVFVNHNQLTGFAGGDIPATVGRLLAQNNQLTTTAVNAILAALVAANKTSGTRVLNLGGTGNAAPTGQGLTDRQTLLDRGWRTATGTTAITN